MALFRVLVGFFVLPFLVEAKLKGLYSPQDQRQVQEQLEERHACIPFDSPVLKSALGSIARLASPECDTNDCGGGCCRFHTNLLVCDDGNEFPQQACVCNANTAVVVRPPSAPSVTVVTPRPTPFSRGEPLPPQVSIPAPPDSCAIPTVYASIDRFVSCKIPKDCAEGLPGVPEDSCCVATYCYCKVPNTLIGEKCVGEPFPDGPVGPIGSGVP